MGHIISPVVRAEFINDLLNQEQVAAVSAVLTAGSSLNGGCRGVKPGYRT